MTLNARSISILPPQVFVGATFLIMLAVSWRKWTSMIVDIGRETDLPFRLMNGEMLYRDIHYLYPPFSPYFNSLLYRVFGVHLDTLAFSGIIFTAILVVLCYAIARKLMPPTGAAIAASLITVLSFKPAGSLILPYSFAGLHGVVFALASVYFTIRFAERRNNRDLVISGVFIGLATITKQEFGFASAATVMACAVFLNRSNVRGVVRDISLAAVPALLIAVPVFGMLFATIDWRILIEDCHLFYTNIPESLEIYNRFRSGLNDPVGSFIQMIGAAAVSLVFAALIIFLSDRTTKLRRTLIFWFAASLAVALLVLFMYREGWDGSPLRALPFLLIAFIVAAWRRERDAGQKLPTSAKGVASPQIVFILAIFSLAILARVALRVPSGGFSGSFYVPPSLILVVYALLVELPAKIKRWTGDDGSYVRARSIAIAFCVIAIVGTTVSFSIRYRSRFGHEISTIRGRLIAERGSGPTLEDALNYVEAHTSDNEVIAVLPEGNDLAFLTGRRINFRHQVLIPDFLNKEDEMQAIDALEKADVRHILITNRPMREFGETAFGEDFNRTLGTYIWRNFETVAVFGDTDQPDPKIGDPKFFIKALKRRDR